jgi:ribosomal protein S18 acetylase RimI-like enzyme
MTDTELEIRPATVQDAVAIAAVHIRSWQATYRGIVSPAALARLDINQRAALWTERLSTMRAGEHTLIGLRHDLVGFVQFGPSPDRDDNPHHCGQILAIHVDPDVTGRGVGRALLAASVQSLAQAGYQRATLWVIVDNDRARRFYERAGWTPDGTRRRETLAVPGETGDEVTVVRYALQLRKNGVLGPRGLYDVQ